MAIVTKYLTYLFDSVTGLNVSADGSTFSINLESPLLIPQDALSCRARVTESSIWNVTPNISAAIGNNKFRYTVGATSYDKTIPDGLYSLDNLSLYISRELQNDGLPVNVITLSGDQASQRTVFIFNSADVVTIDLTGLDTPADLLGFNNRLITSTPTISTETGDFVANFNRSEYFLIQTNLFNGGIPFNDKSTGIIHKALITAEPGSKTTYTPYIPAIVNADILIGARQQYLTFSLLDQLNRNVDTNSETWSFTLEIAYDLKY